MIVGGGVVGFPTAYLLATEALKVTVIEADSVGSRASGFAFGEMNDLECAGIPDPLLEFSFWSNRHHRNLAVQLLQVSGIDNQYRRVTRLSLAFDQSATNL